jgi:hypothetical protein
MNLRKLISVHLRSSAVPFLFSSMALAAAPAITSHIQVLSDQTPDVSSLEAWKASFIKPGMTDEQKAMAIWRTVTTFRHQDIPPNEFLANEDHPHDPIKDFNVYGYGQCCCASANIEALARYAGLQTRGWGITAHSVPEIYYNDAWHLLDASLITYFPKKDGTLAGVQEISAGIAAWYKAHPEFKGNDKKLTQFMRDNGWKNGPEILSRCPSYDPNGWLPAATHGWYSTMGEYGRADKNFVYDYGSAQGYQVNNQLRQGEKITFNWGNKGLHVNMFDGGAPGCLKKTVGTDDLRYSPKYGDLAPGRIGNGVHEYAPNLADPAFPDACIEFTNLSQTPTGLRIKDAAKDATLILEMPSSYVYLTGNVAAKTTGAVAIAFSDNNGLDWTDLASSDLSKLVFRRYDYRLKFTFKGEGAGLSELHITHDIQHSQRPLPALAQGENHITFKAGPQEGTLTIEGSTNAKSKGKQLLLADFHPDLKGIRPSDSGLWIGDSGSATISLPISTPGDITRLRLGLFYRARDKRDNWTIEASFDNGTTWKPIGKVEGPYQGNSAYFTFSDVPAGSRTALVRLSGQQRNTAGIHDLRLDADYAQPHGGLGPIQITYNWEEAGQSRSNTHTAQTASESYTITCAAKPLLKSLTLQRD